MTVVFQPTPFEARLRIGRYSLLQERNPTPAGRTCHRKEADMHCQLCRNLEQAFETRRSAFVEASSLASFQVSSRFAAYLNVEMERALIELQEHRSICRSTVNEAAGLPVLAHHRRGPQEVRRTSPVGTAA
jgi:hypothetical protein